MAERNLPSALKTSLIKNDSYTYFHLIKFERPNGVASSNFVAGKATDYAYITDSSINIDFDDGSKSSKGVANGPQTYVANKVLKVGTVNETTEAKASNMSLVLSGTALGTIVTTSAAFASSSMTTTIDLLEAGFQEGDILLLESAGNTNNNKYARINKFTNANKTVALTGIDCTIDDAVSQTYNLSYASEEISALLNSKEATNYTNYVNREVFIYRGHFAADTLYESDGTTVRHNAGDIIGKPFVIFKGIISKGSVQDDALKDSKVSWNLTSHWGDFVRVQGRLTSDYSHRALSITGGSDVGALVRPEYQYDLGFAHAERSINLIATYQTQETRYKMKKRGGLAGFIGLKKTVEYQVEVDREVDLQFNLTARSLPVVYGVQKVDSIPVFADVIIKADGSSEVYVAHAFAEGEIGGIFDVHIEDTSSVCLDQNDKDNRTASNGVNIACYGRADKGFVLAGQSGRTTTEVPFILSDEDLDRKNQDTNQGGYDSVYRTPQSGSTFNDPSRTGLQHETTFTLHHAPTPTTIFVHTGKSDQDADDTLVQKASLKSFKLQNQLSDINPNNYWSPNHRLLDTAYVSAKYSIGEGETTISKLEFVVSGKKVRSYNYDHSYDQDSAGASAGQEFFNLGDQVTLHRTHAETVDGVSYSADSQIGSSAVTIIDKWSFYRDSTTLLYRFRFSSNPQADTNSTAFYMKRTVDSVVRKWFMVSYNHIMETITPKTVNTPFTFTVSAISAYDATGGNHAKRVITITSANPALLSPALLQGARVCFEFAGETPTTAFHVLQINPTTNKITVVDNNNPEMRVIHNKFLNLSGSETCTMRNLNIVNLNTSASTVNDAYNGRSIVLKRFDANDNITHEEERDIIDYVVASGVNVYAAKLSSVLPFDFNPGAVSGDSYTIEAGQAEQDIRVSINPAIQLLDYLKNKRYGKGLDDNDINLPTFLQAARDCDIRSDVTIQVAGDLTTGSNIVQPGDVFGYTTTVSGEVAKLRFQGTVKSLSTNDVDVVGSDGTTLTSTRFTQVVFTNVLGKIATKWADWKTFEQEEFFWHEEELYKATTTGTKDTPVPAGVNLTSPTTGNYGRILSNLPLTSFSRVAGSGSQNISASIQDGFASSGDPLVKSFTNSSEGFNSPGYSLYDSDHVKYWKYLGWDEPNQRFVTRHQTNQVIDTSVPLFDNINSMLKQFNGILRYSGGKYELAIKSAAPASSSFETFQTINDVDIIGKIKLQDKGQKGIFNSMSANVVDPQNNYNARSISYFNSDYLKEDKGIRRSGQFAMPGISNYFNSRINIKQFLDESRYGLDISFTLDSKAYLLLTGEIIRITNERFGWYEKFFRIDNLNFQANGLVQVTATEHNDAAYLIGAIKTPYSTKGLEEAAAGSVAQTPISTPAGLTGLTATSGGKGAIDLAWTNSTSFNTATHTTEVWASSTNDRTNATLIYTTQSAKMSDIVAEQTLVTKFYWVRHTVVTENGLVVPSAYFPTSSTAGVQGTATGAIDGSDGSDGARGPGRWHIQVSSLPTTSSAANTAWGSGSGSQPSAAVVNDQAWFHTGTVSSPTGQKVWIYAGSGNWTEQTEFIDGDLIVSGTVTADRMNVTTLSSITADIGSITAGTVKGGNIPDANASPSGSEAGAFLDLTGGKVVFGNASKHILFNGSSLVLSGVTIDETSVVNSTAGVILQEDGSQEATAATTLNFTTGLNVAVTGSAPAQTATISLDSGFATLASPAFTGTPTAPTASDGANTTQLATTQFVSTAVSNLVDSAPSDLNTLNELAAALADDDAFSTTVNTSLGNRLRVDTASQGLSSTQKTNALTNLAIQNINNTSDANKPLSTAQQTALNLKANLASPTFTGTVSGISKSMVGLGNVANESKATMFSSAALTGTPTAPTAGSSTNNTQLATTAFVQSVASGAAGGASGTTYTVSIPSSTTKLRLSGSDSTTDDIEFVGSGATTVTRTNDGKFTISSTDTNTNTNTQNQYAISCVDGDNSDEEKIRLSGSGHNGNTTDDIVLEAGTGLSIARSGDKITFTNTDGGSGAGTVTSVGISHGGNAFNTGSAVTTSGTLAITMAGSSSQYVNGAGNLVTFPSIPSAANNGVVTLAAGTDLHINEADKNFSMDQSNSQTITFDHDAISRTNNTSSASPSYGATFTAIDSITTSTQGHVTAVNTKTITIPASDNTQGLTSITAGSLIDVSGSGSTQTVNVDLTELTDMTQTWNNSADEFVVIDTSANTQKRKKSDEIFGSNAFNSTSFLTGNQTITLSGDVSGSGTTSINVTVADDSHNHIISNVDGLQSALDGKQASGTYVTSVSGTAPVVSSGGTTPAISVTTAAVADNGTSLATGDQIHTFVTGQGFVTSSGITGVSGTAPISVTSGNTPTVSIAAASSSSAGSMSQSDKGKLDSIVIDSSLDASTPITLNANFGSLSAAIANIGTLNSANVNADFLNADAVITRDIRVGPETIINATAMVSGRQYTITGPLDGNGAYNGTTTFTTGGASSNNKGVLFIYNGATLSGNGTVRDYTDAANIGASTAAGSMTAGKSYIITSLGNTNNNTWSNLAGTPTNQFLATGYLQAGYIEYSIGDIITISTANGSAGTGTGIELSGEGSHLNSDGDFLVGKVSTKNLMYFDSGIGQLMMGEIKVKEINDIVLTKGSGMSFGSNATPRNNCVYVGLGANGQGYGNTSVGDGAGSGIGFNNTSYATNGTAAENTTIGYHAGHNKISGSKNVFIGANVARVQAGVTSPSLSGDRNIGIGGHADGSEVVNGYCTFGNLSSGSDNVSIGSGSAQSLTTGNDNVFLGNNSGFAMTTGSNNVIIGTFSGNAGGYDIRTSSNNLVLSDGAGNIKLKFDTSANATFTGKVITSNSSGFSGPKFDTTDGTRFLQLQVFSGYNQISSMASSSGSAQELRFTQGLSGTQLAIRYNQIQAHESLLLDGATTTAASTANIISATSNDGNGTTQYHIVFTKSNASTPLGRITTNNFGTTYTTSSDYRLKENVQAVAGATNKVLSLNPVNFQWKDSTVTQDGFLAHEVAEVVPEAVVGEKDGAEMQSIDQSKLVPLLVKTIQELEARITALENP